MNRKSDKFFGRKYLINAGWAVLIAVFSFAAGRIYDELKGPQPVIVKNIKEFNQSLFNPVEYPKNIVSIGTERSIRRLSDEIQKLRDIIATKQLNDPQIAEIKSRISTLDGELKSLKGTVPSKTLDEGYAKHAEQPIASTEERKASFVAQQSNLLQYPRFILPKNVKGYTRASLEGFTGATCPEQDIQTYAILDISFNPMDVSPPKSITPLFVDISRINSVTSQERVYFEQYRINEGNNLIKIAIIDLKPGNYELGYGYYREEELNKEYPPFYSKICKLKVTDRLSELNKQRSELEKKSAVLGKKRAESEEKLKAIKPP